MTVSKQSPKNEWKRSARAVFTITVLSAVAIAGITSLGSKVLAIWKTPGNSDQALSSGGLFEGFLNFAAPAETVAQLKTKAEEREKDIKMVGNWQYTASPALANLFQTNLALDFFLFQNNNSNGIQEFLEANPPLNYIVASGALTFFGRFLEALLPRLSLPLARLVEAYVNFLRGLQASVNSFIPPAFRPPPIPPVSPAI